MDVKFNKRLSLFVVGLYLLGLGISMTIQAASILGVGAWDAINIRLNQLYPIFTIGNYLIIVSVFCCILAGLILKKIPKFYYLVTSFLLGYSIDFNLYVFKHFLPNLNKYIVFVLGLVVIAVATHIYMSSKLLISPIDYLMEAIINRFKLNIGVAKFFVELIAIIISLVISAPISVGTIIIMVSLGPLYGMSEKPVKKLIHYYLKPE